jgi:hypothetical protein
VLTNLEGWQELNVTVRTVVATVPAPVVDVDFEEEEDDDVVEEEEDDDDVVVVEDEVVVDDVLLDAVEH